MISPRSAGWSRCAGLLVSACLSVSAATARDFFVDNLKGHDGNEGTEAAPFKTVQKGADLAEAGDTIYLAANPEPYREAPINFRKSGNADAPIVLDGRGAVLSGILKFQPDSWKDVGGGVYAMAYDSTTPTQAQLEREYKLVFFDGVPGKVAGKKEDLQPLGFFVDEGAAGKMIFIRLPDGQTPADISVAIMRTSHTGFHVSGSHITVKNLTSSNTSEDGFSTTHGKNIVFENVRGCYNMDQGMSHHGSTAFAKNSIFDHNADAGIRDVWPDCESTYERCIFAYNQTSGIDAKGKLHVIRDSLFLNNNRTQIRVEKDASANVDNCYFLAPGLDGVGIYKSTCTVSRCTFANLQVGFRAGQGSAMLEGNAFLNNELPLAYFEHADAERPTYEFIKSDNNLFVGGQFKLGESKPVIPFADYLQQTGQDADSIEITELGESEASALPIKYDGRSFGASVKLGVIDSQFANPDPAMVPKP